MNLLGEFFRFGNLGFFFTGIILFFEFVFGRVTSDYQILIHYRTISGICGDYFGKATRREEAEHIKGYPWQVRPPLLQLFGFFFVMTSTHKKPCQEFSRYGKAIQNFN